MMGSARVRRTSRSAPSTLSPEGSGWRLQDSQPQVARMLVKLLGEDAVPVMNQKVGMVRRDRFVRHGPGDPSWAGRRLVPL
jgi:hypothetical protein